MQHGPSLRANPLLFRTLRVYCWDSIQCLLLLIIAVVLCCTFSRFSHVWHSVIWLSLQNIALSRLWSFAKLMTRVSLNWMLSAIPLAWCMQEQFKGVGDEVLSTSVNVLSAGIWIVYLFLFRSASAAGAFISWTFLKTQNFNDCSAHKPFFVLILDKASCGLLQPKREIKMNAFLISLFDTMRTLQLFSSVSWYPCLSNVLTQIFFDQSSWGLSNQIFYH